MRVALVADIHGNLPALEAVLEAVGALRPERVVCLGDLVGYGAEPSACIGLIRRAADAIVAGNHDRDVLAEDAQLGTNAPARVALRWTRQQLSDHEVSFLAALPCRIDDGTAGVVAVHGCYLNPLHTQGYVTSTMLEPNLLAIAAGPPGRRVGLCGHTHVPMIGWLTAGACEEPRGDVVRWPATAIAVLVNPGSVGQPRDGDPRAAFAIVDPSSRTVEFHRVRYDVARAASAIRDAGLPESLALRLEEGR